ncbi:MAG TPA: hypothetical protein VM513_08065 [Kofleriaceae bacterium]|nr:hypothetical protein [Kofleriaceae bacterium]
MDRDEDADRDAILKRRHRFIAMALAGASLSLASCTSEPVPCLRIAYDAGPPADAGTDDGDGSADADR